MHPLPVLTLFQFLLSAVNGHAKVQGAQVCVTRWARAASSRMQSFALYDFAS